MNKRFTIMVVLLVVMTGRVLADASTYLNFTAVNGPATISLDSIGVPNSISLQYSTDNCNTWNNYEIGQVISLISGDKVFFKATNVNPALSNWHNEFNISTFNYYKFVMAGTVSADGNIMSLLDSSMQQSSVPVYAFGYIFENCTSLISAPELPATTLSDNCYGRMFSGCTSLTTPPTLPATTLSSGCYTEMFLGCTSLISTPDLPAVTLATYCYKGMFKNCTTLTTATNLPATILPQYSCQEMFYGCTSLITAPTISAQVMDKWCCTDMFNGCTSLTTTPDLYSVSLEICCCLRMFAGCTSLTTAPALPATTMFENCYASMFENCASLTVAPILPAVAMHSGSYCKMFKNCTSLKKAPDLPATTLHSFCYSSMFDSCTSLISIPVLPATSLSAYCYENMFKNCINLKIDTTVSSQSWQIPSEATPAERWNTDMFSGTGGTFTGDPEIGVTYYIASDTTVTDVVNVIDEANISLYPNPVHIGETVHVSADEELNMVEVYNVDGVCVQRMESPGRSIEIKGLNCAGVYIVRMTNKNNRVSTRKLIVN